MPTTNSQALLFCRKLKKYIFTVDAKLAKAVQQKGRWALIIHELLWFGIKQAWACLFGGLMLALLLITYFLWPDNAPLYRYDFITISALIIQFILLKTGLETKEEGWVILMFHMTGTIMELFKTATGSWVYPEPALLRIGGVPLFTGFMYASVGSYIARVWRLFSFRFTKHPPWLIIAVIALLIYLNFFTDHYGYDGRLFLFLGVALLFGRTWVYFYIRSSYRKMPLLLGFFLVALFIWLAENLGTFAGAWYYPSQTMAWHIVPLSKLGSWFLLMIISYGLVASLHQRELTINDNHNLQQ